MRSQRLKSRHAQKLAWSDSRLKIQFFEASQEPCMCMLGRCALLVPCLLHAGALSLHVLAGLFDHAA